MRTNWTKVQDLNIGDKVVMSGKCYTITGIDRNARRTYWQKDDSPNVIGELPWSSHLHEDLCHRVETFA